MNVSSIPKLTKSEIKKLIFKEVPRLIKKDLEIREFILRISSERFADKKKTEDIIERLFDELRKEREESNKKWELNEKRWQENQRRWEENEKRWEENQRRWEENEKRWEENQRRWELNEKRWQENQKVINSILEEIKILHRKYDTGVGAIGARWGLRAEASFRNAIKDILEETLPYKVERYTTMDEEGIVFGRPDQVELDLLIRNGETIVAEIKSSISKGDVATFIRKIQVFKKKEKRTPTKELIISPMVDKNAMEFAVSNGIKVYGYPEEINIADLQS